MRSEASARLPRSRDENGVFMRPINPAAVAGLTDNQRQRRVDHAISAFRPASPLCHGRTHATTRQPGPADASSPSSSSPDCRPGSPSESDGGDSHRHRRSASRLPSDLAGRPPAQRTQTIRRPDQITRPMQLMSFKTAIGPVRIGRIVRLHRNPPSDRIERKPLHHQRIVDRAARRCRRAAARRNRRGRPGCRRRH